MNEPFEAYSGIERMKQQMHLHELELGQKLEQQRKQAYRSPQMNNLSSAWTGFRFGAGLRLNDLLSWLGSKKKNETKKTGVDLSQNKSVYDIKAGNEDTENVPVSSQTDKAPGRPEASAAPQEEGTAEQKAEAAKNSSHAAGCMSDRGREIISRIPGADELNEMQRAVLWAEVLGEPVSRKRRRNGR